MTYGDVRMRGFRGRADVADVLAWVDARPAPRPAEEVHLLGAAGRVLASAVTAEADVPAFRRSAMDGWAVRGTSTFGATDAEPRPLRLVGDARPGRACEAAVGEGEAVRIRTGAPMPAGADAVLPAEDGEERAGEVLARGEVPPGRHVGEPGEDVRAGSEALPAGRRLRPQDVALLSALGRARVAALRKPRVAVLVTGEEVLPAGTRPQGARIADANGPLLDALVRRDGGAPLQRGIFGDDDPRLEAEIAEAPADVVLVTGASSVGPEDRVPEIVARRGDLVFHGLALRPASPTGLGVVAGRPVFLLPGNPVSALCAYDLFAGRLVRRLGGRSPDLPYPVRRLPLARKVVSELGRTDYLRVRVVDGRVEPLTARGAGVLSTAVRQEQFLHVVSVEEARRRWDEALAGVAPRVERVRWDRALDRVLAQDVVAPADVPSFDRSNLDGFAVRAQDTFGAEDESPRTLRVTGETLVPGVAPSVEVGPGEATPVATGARVPRGADAVVPVEHTDVAGDRVLVRRPVVPGAALSAAGGDVARGETVLRAGARLTSRETGTLAACGIPEVLVVARPRVAVLSSGGEIVPPDAPAGPGLVHDANGTILSDAVREAGGEPLPVEIVPDDARLLGEALARALERADVVLLSGGTSKGAGDLAPGVVAGLGPPGLVVHGVDLKPGKPLGLAVCRGKPVALLPGFPTSAVFTFHEFVAPLLRRLGGRRERPLGTVRARIPRRLPAERGRTEYLLVLLVEGAPGPDGVRHVAWPMGKGSGSVTAFARADGFVRVPGNVDHLERDEVVEVTLLGREARPADLVLVGSHCTGLDALLSRLARAGFECRTLFVGSQAGLDALARGECDVATAHLLDPATGRWNEPFLPAGARLLPGYRRRQVLAFRPGDPRFEGRALPDALAAALADPRCRMQNRQPGSGTRIVVERLLGEARPPGWHSASRSHHAVAAAVAQERADWGVCLDGVARGAGLRGIPVADEHYDFAVREDRWDRPAVAALRAALADPAVARDLLARGFHRP